MHYMNGLRSRQLLLNTELKKTLTKQAKMNTGKIACKVNWIRTVIVEMLGNNIINICCDQQIPEDFFTSCVFTLII